MTTVGASELDQLWNAEERSADRGPQQAGRAFLLLPSIEHPRLVLPTRPHRAAVVIVNALRDRSSTSARARTLAVRAVLATGVRTTQLPDPEILTVASAHLPEREYVYGVHLGPPRANRKPVLVLVTPEGELVAFVKWGVNSLTDRLVHNEASALETVSHLSTLSVPHLLGAGDLRAHPYVVQSPVLTRGRGRMNTAHVLAAQIEVAAIGRGSVDTAAALKSVADQWYRRVSAPSPVEHDVAAFAELAYLWVERASDASIRWGSWHGDWRRTNMAATASGCSVWDWERFATGVPVGYDALHLFLMSLAPSVRDLASLPVDLFHNAERLLRPFDVHGRARVELTTTGYLLELAGRYLDDNQSQSGARLGTVAEWMLPFLSAQLRHDRTRPSGQGVSDS